MSESRRLLLAACSGVLLFLAFPPFPLGFLSLLALVPLFFALQGASPRRSFTLGLTSGVIFSCGLLYWVPFVEVEGVVRFYLTAGVMLLWLYLGLWVAIFSFFSTTLARKLGGLGVFSIPFIWTTLEFVRSLSPQVGFPWGSLAYTLSYYPSLIQFSSSTGLPGVTFLVVAINLLIYLSMRRIRTTRKAVYYLTTLLLLLLLPWLHGTISMRREVPSEGSMRVALLQVNVDPDVKRGGRLYREYRMEVLKKETIRAAQQGVDLIIWPETAVPGVLARNTEYRNLVEELSRRLGVPILTGTTGVTPREAGGYNYYNSAVYVTPEAGISQEYNKVYLVPFSEKLPFDDVFPFLRSIHFGQGDFSPGKSYTVFSHPKGGFSALICFESIFPRLVRQFVRRGARLLVNITEDSWFGRTAGPYQHAQMAIFRAIEYRIAVARCANTGVSKIIDHYGRVRNRTRIFTRTIVIDSLSLGGGNTFYARYGDLFAWGCVVITVGLLAVTLTRRKHFAGLSRP